MELYIGNNQLSYYREIQNLKVHQKLIILDISNNPMRREEPHIREYAIFHLKKLKVLDGVGIEMGELKNSKQRFAGRLTEELLENRYKGAIKDATKLDLSQAKLRDFDEAFTTT